MRTFAVVVLALLAACERSGVQFTVYIPADYGADGDPAVQLPDEVRLFIGIGDEHGAALGPDGFTDGESRSGTYWLRDPNNLPDVDRAPIGIESPATFSFGRDGDLAELGAVVAVGYTAGVPTSSAAVFHARVGDGSVYQYRMGLNGAADPRTRAMRSRVNQLEVWGANECVHIDNRRSDIQDRDHRVAYIVGSHEDRDCDGLAEGAANECNADVYLGAAPAKVPSCMFSDAAGAVCTVGVARCRDGVGDDGSCNRTRFCAPAELCVRCTDPATKWACAQDYQSVNGGGVGAYGLQCQIPAMKGAGSISQLCNPEFAAQIIPPAGTTCQDVAVKAASDPDFRDRFSLAGQGNTASVKVTAQGCTLTIAPSGTVNGTTSTLDYGALMLVALDQGRGLAVPVHVQVVPGVDADVCDTPSSCEWIAQGSSPDACVLGSI